MWNFVWRNPENAHRVYTCKPWHEYKPPKGDEEIAVVEDYVTAFSVFKTIAPTTQSTTVIATPKSSGSISVTDILISSRKAANAVLSLNFTDGTKTETVFTTQPGTSEFFMNHSVKGRMQGWRDARLEFIIATQDVVTHVTIVYMQLPTGLLFTDWDALR